MFLESRFRSKKPLLGILSRILEDLFEDPFEKYASFSKSMTYMIKSDDTKHF
jgi:hypothetical protein